MRFAILIIVAYLLGSIPFGLVIAAAYGKDLRKIGSGNIGATNVARALGRKWAYFCFLLDVLKGLVPMLAARFLTQVANPTPGSVSLWLVVGCAAVLGHIFPIYLKFKGGKGVATSFGVALGLWPYYTTCAVIAITSMGGSCSNMAIYLAGLDDRFNCFSYRIDSCDSLNAQLGFCQSMAAACRGNCNTGNGDYAPPREYKTAVRRNRKQSLQQIALELVFLPGFSTRIPSSLATGNLPATSAIREMTFAHDLTLPMPE